MVLEAESSVVIERRAAGAGDTGKAHAVAGVSCC